MDDWNEKPLSSIDYLILHSYHFYIIFDNCRNIYKNAWSLASRTDYYYYLYSSRENIKVYDLAYIMIHFYSTIPINNLLLKKECYLLDSKNMFMITWNYLIIICIIIRLDKLLHLSIFQWDNSQNPPKLIEI